MANNCINNDCVDAAWLSKYWMWRWLLPLLLLIPLLFLLLRGCNANTAGPATQAAVVPTAVPAPSCDAFSGNAIAGEEVTFTGSTVANGTIRIVADGKTSLGSTQANGSGDWSLTTKFLRAGNYNVAASLMDGDTRLSSCSGQSVSVGEPAKAEINKPTVDRLGTKKLGALALAGTGTAGSLLEIYCNGASIGTTTVGANGQWVFDTSHDEAGEYEYAAFAKDSDGNILISDSATAVVEAEPEPEPEPEPTAEPEPTPEPTPEPEPVAECVRPVISSASGGQPATEPVVVTGTASANSEITVIANGVDVATTTPDADGNWSISAVLGDDTYDIVARSACEDAATKQSNTATLVVGTGTPAQFTVEVAEEPTVEDPGVALEGSAPEGELSIFTGETLLGTTTSLDGTWDFVSTCSLAPGEYELNVTASDGSAQTVTVNVPNLAPAYVPPTGDAGVTYEKLVCSGTPAFGEIIGTTYIVAECESMSLIAQRMGTTLAEIIRYNPQVTDPGAIYAGQILNIPVGASCLDG